MLCEIICDHFKQPRIQFYRQRFEYRFPYCDCPYSELCKHEVAVAITLRMLFKQPQFKLYGFGSLGLLAAGLSRRQNHHLNCKLLIFCIANSNTMGYNRARKVV